MIFAVLAELMAEFKWLSRILLLMVDVCREIQIRLHSKAK
jgi:hypothetical protein